MPANLVGCPVSPSGTICCASAWTSLKSASLPSRVSVVISSAPTPSSSPITIVSSSCSASHSSGRSSSHQSVSTVRIANLRKLLGVQQLAHQKGVFAPFECGVIIAAVAIERETHFLIQRNGAEIARAHLQQTPDCAALAQRAYRKTQQVRSQASALKQWINSNIQQG